MYENILLTTDGSKYSKKAGEHAIELAKLIGSNITVLSVIETSYIQTLPEGDLIERMEDVMKKEGQNALDSFAQQLEMSNCNGSCENITLKTELKVGSPSETILETIKEENIDLVIMGNSGKHGLDRFLLGSVAEKVLRSATCPVLVVR